MNGTVNQLALSLKICSFCECPT